MSRLSKNVSRVHGKGDSVSRDGPCGGYASTYDGRIIPAITKFLVLAPAERKLFFRAVTLLWLTRAAILFGCFQKLRWALGRLARSGESAGTGVSNDLVVGAVLRACRCVPGVSCLVQALVAEALLARYGYPARIWAGVAKGPEGALQAHAWVECEGRIVCGGRGGYTPLGVLGRPLR